MMEANKSGMCRNMDEVSLLQSGGEEATIEAVLAGDWDRPDSERLEESLMICYDFRVNG